MNTNPYAPPITPLAPIPQWSDICVDGDCLVVRDGVTLPLRCVITNEPVSSLALREHVFDATPSFRLVLRRYQCRVMVGLAPSERRKQARQFILHSSIILIAVFCPILLNSLFPSSYATALVPLVLILLAMISGKPQGALRVVKSEADRVWLAGCCPEFLAFVRREYGTLHAHAVRPAGDFESL